MAYAKLKGRIVEKYGSLPTFAEALFPDKKCPKNALYSRLNGIYEWSQNDIQSACVLLGISASKVGCYFFTQEVEKN